MRNKGDFALLAASFKEEKQLNMAIEAGFGSFLMEESLFFGN